MGDLWIGTYTGARGDGRGIHRARTRADGSVELVGEPVEVPSPSYLARHPGGHRLYAVSEDDAPALLELGVDGDRAWLSRSTPVPDGPCHLAVAAGASHVLVASYDAGTVSAVPLDDAGGLAGPARTWQGAGSGPVAGRQDGPHAHAVALAPDGLVLSVDLGADLVRTLRVDTAGPQQVSQVALPAGSGPRHLVVHPSGPVFVVTELARTVLVLAPGRGYDDLQVVAESSATVGSTDETSQCAAIRLSDDGRFLWTTTRGADVLTTHEVLDGGARVRPVADTPTGGTWPRDLAVDGDLLHVANERSGTVLSFRTDPRTGVPRLVGEPTAVTAAVCVLVDPPA